MFPFGGLLTSISRELKVPGQDFQETFSTLGDSPVFSGLRFNPNGNMERRLALGNYQQLSGINAETWIHSDFHPFLVDGTYEARFIYQSGSGIGELMGSAENTWITIGPGFPGWFVRADSFFETVTVQGLIQVREIADTGNIRTGDVVIEANDQGP